MAEIDDPRIVASKRGWLSQTPASFRHAVLERSVLQEFQAGEKIYSSGDSSAGMYGLISGGVGVWFDKGERAPSFAHFFQPGTWFGEGPIISGHPRLVGLVATRATKLLYLAARSIEDIVHNDPNAWRLIAGLVLAKLNLAIGAIDDLMIRDNDKRLIAVLLRLGDCRTARVEDAPVEVDVSQEDLAAMANVARTTANAILGRLAAAGLVTLAYRRVVILGHCELRAMLTE